MFPKGNLYWKNRNHNHPNLLRTQFKKGHNKGIKLTEEHKRKIGEAQLGKIISLKSRKKMSLAKIGKPILKARKRIIIKCIICNKTFEVSYIKGLRRKTCSYKCISKLYQKELLLNNNPNWKGGKSFEPYPIGWRKSLKEKIRKRDKYMCRICKIPEIKCSRKLEIHHIDYKKDNLKMDNLISLCIHCHMKTNGNRKHWREILSILSKDITK